MFQPVFNIQRSVYDPQPARALAITAKHEIQTKGGEFFIITVNGCNTPKALVDHVVKQFDIPLPVTEQALDMLAGATVDGYSEVVSDTWAVVEHDEDGNTEATKFVAFAFTPEEIELKTALFVEGIRQFKTVLVDYLGKREKNQLWAAPITAIEV